jgi:ADP-heptose:LPS heptosyltransferase
MHLASAVGTPTIAIFSSRNMPGIWFPTGNEGNIFYNNVDCRGCGLEVCIARQQRCIREISPAAVAVRVDAILNAASPAHAAPLPVGTLASGNA